MNDIAHQRWLTQLEDIDLAIAREAIICGVPLLENGVVERVIDADDGVCRHRNAVAFRKLRGLVLMHVQVHQRAVEVLGPAHAAFIAHEVRQHLRGRIGDQLGR